MSDDFSPEQAVGPYRPIRELGRGGMGVVHLAERVDGQVHPQVALKLIKRGLDTEEILARYLRERPILARLQHPHVARLLDGGLSAQGRLYFAMEYVDGQPITAWCDERRSSVPERLRLFLDACSAVRHAHRSLVVHGDLKPSNILVTSEGVVKLLDFGIARLLGTQAGPRPMTSEYAAPEQVKGEPPITAADVYALGLVLYELLSGWRAYRLSGATPSEMEMMILHTNPEEPSQAATSDGDAAELAGRRGSTPVRLWRALKGDLDAIVLTALRKEPGRRYASVEALMEDLRRYVSREPIVARPTSRAYRLRKFASRHRVGLAAASVVLALLVAFAVSMGVMAGRQRRERERAEDELSATLTSLGRTLEGEGKFDEAQRLMERVLKLEEERHGPETLQVATALADLGSVLSKKGRYEQALEVETRSLALARLNEPADSPDLLPILTQYSGLLALMEKHDESVALQREAVQIGRKALGDDHPFTIDAVHDLAIGLDQQKRHVEAEALFREELEKRTRLLGPDDITVAKAQNALARSLREQGRIEEAGALLEEAAALARRVAGPEHPETLRILGRLPSIYEKSGKADRAESLEREVLAIRRKVLGPAHPDVARSLSGVGKRMVERRRYAEAETLLKECLSIRVGALGEEHPQTQSTRQELADLYHAWGKPDLAAQVRPPASP